VERREFERRLAQENTRLRESEGRFARFMHHLPGLAWAKDVQGRYVYANAAAERAFGRPAAELYGKTDAEVFPPNRLPASRRTTGGRWPAGRACK
jgi:PAS domain S-box-containing protein